MENAALLSLLKWLFPSIVGAVLAVYYKGKSIGWGAVSSMDKFYLTLIVIGAIFLSVSLSHYLGGTVIEYFEIDKETKYASLIYLMFAFSGIKITDALASNLDIWINKFVDFISKIIDKFIGRF